MQIFVWEILINICNDYILLFEHRLRLPTVVYFISRYVCYFFQVWLQSSQLIRLLSKDMLFRVYYICCCNSTHKWAQIFPKLFHNQTSDFSSAILSNSMCIILERLVVTFYCAAVIFTSLLFFFRTRAVFNAYPWMVAFFAGLWLAVLGGCVALIVNIYEPIPESASGIPLCIKPGMDPFVAASTIIPLINDTLVFLAISWRLSRNSYYPDTLESGIRLLIFGDYLPVFSKALLQDGQAYYLLALS